MKVRYCKPLFATTLFRDLSEMNWFAPTNFRDQELSTPGFFYNNMPEISATMSSREARKKFSHANKSFFYSMTEHFVHYY